MASKFCSECGAEYTDLDMIPLEKDGRIYCPITKRMAELVATA